VLEINKGVRIMGANGKVVEVNATAQTAPLCPSCEEPLSEIRVHDTKVGFAQKVHLLSCPHCRKFLGSSFILP
jgi:hypothetical protein